MIGADHLVGRQASGVGRRALYPGAGPHLGGAHCFLIWWHKIDDQLELLPADGDLKWMADAPFCHSAQPTQCAQRIAFGGFKRRRTRLTDGVDNAPGEDGQQGSDIVDCVLIPRIGCIFPLGASDARKTAPIRVNGARLRNRFPSGAARSKKATRSGRSRRAGTFTLDSSFVTEQ